MSAAVPVPPDARCSECGAPLDAIVILRLARAGGRSFGPAYELLHPKCDREIAEASR